MRTISDTVIFTLCVVTFIIGVHQAMTFGIAQSYYIFMISIGLLFLYRYRKAKREENEKPAKQKQAQKRKNKH
ncbi:MAG: 4-hydroxybenzoate polyprenyltransferase [Roseivirga sp.]|jgi:4-hydroxybenzoate polyprenyltransferase